MSAALIGLAGCPGSLEDPERFRGGGGGACSVDTETEILSATCSASICHDSDMPTAGLDLSGTAVASRLLDRPALTGGDCEGAGLIIDSASPENSLLLRKVEGTAGCGAIMPPPLGLQDDDLVACVRDYVLAAAGGGGGTDGGATDGGAGEDAGPDDGGM
jgi:hypothetical protein